MNREGRLYFCYPQYKSVDDIYKLLRDCIRRYGVKWIVLDNLQRLCDTTIGGKNRTQHLSEISKVTSQIAKDHKIQMIRILQPHRVGEGRMVNTDNVDGSSQIAKDCDSMITIHRDRMEAGSLEEFKAVGYVQGDGTCTNKMKVTVGLSRYSAGGYTTLDYDGARSRVTEFNLSHIAEIVKESTRDVGYTNQLRNLNIVPNPA
jgi:replicative DNA helicase